MSLEQVRISVSAETGVRILRLSGVLGVTEGQELHGIASQLCDSERDIRIEWSEVSQLHACILQVVLVLVDEITAAGRSLILGPPSPEVAINLRTAGFGFLLDGVLSR